MLYITTHDNRDAHTAYKALHTDVAQDGGLYVPFHLPSFTQEEILSFRNKSFGETAAHILNLFFSARLTAWEIDSCIGRSPIRITALNRKIYAAELWHNLEGVYGYLEKCLYSRLASESGLPSNWARIAIEIAALFGVYGCALQQELLSESQSFEIAVSVGDFTTPMAAIYAKKLGLPIGNVIMCAQDNSALWDLINRGEMGTSLLTPERKLGAERLIHSVFGTEETLRFHSICQRHGVYTVSEEQLPAISDGLFAAVVSENRINTTINSIYRTNQYLISPKGAVCHAGLQDYRAKAGESSPTFLLTYESPMSCHEALAQATGLGIEEIQRLQKGV